MDYSHIRHKNNYDTLEWVDIYSSLSDSPRFSKEEKNVAYKEQVDIFLKNMYKPGWKLEKWDYLWGMKIDVAGFWFTSLSDWSEKYIKAWMSVSSVVDPVVYTNFDDYNLSHGLHLIQDNSTTWEQTICDFDIRADKVKWTLGAINDDPVEISNPADVCWDILEELVKVINNSWVIN